MGETLYEKRVWVNNVTPLNEENMNHIENGIEAIDIALGSKLSQSDIVQELGNSETAVMSQKSATDIFASKEYLSEEIDNIAIPDYVKAEAEATIAKSFSHGNLGRTIRFIAITDSHNIAESRADAPNKINIYTGNKHAGQAIKYIVDRIGIDFAAFLGDGTGAGETDEPYTKQLLVDDITSLNQYLADGFAGHKNVRLVGNHDQMKATDGRLMNSGAYGLIGRFSAGKQDGLGGYGYLDFEGQKVRVIYLNTSDTTASTASGTLIAISDKQKDWLCETLIDLNEKPDADNWKILLLSHVPLDFGSANIGTDILLKYVNGGTYGSYTFTKHDAHMLGNCHGHMHCFNYNYIADTIRRFCIPNSSYLWNNHYGGRDGYNGWNDETTYQKTPNSGDDTAFSLVTIDLDSQICYVDNYGAGIDRVFSCDYNIPTPPAYTDLVPGAIDSTGEIFNGTGYKTGCYIDSSSGAPFVTVDSSEFTSVGLIPYTSTSVHDIYIKGINFGGSGYNRVFTFDVNKNRLEKAQGLRDGFTSAAVISAVTKLADAYYKVTTIASATGRPKYITFCGGSVSGQAPIITIDEPIS